jgi:hypothetical protein
VDAHPVEGRDGVGSKRFEWLTARGIEPLNLGGRLLREGFVSKVSVKDLIGTHALPAHVDPVGGTDHVEGWRLAAGCCCGQRSRIGIPIDLDASAVLFIRPAANATAASLNVRP